MSAPTPLRVAHFNGRVRNGAKGRKFRIICEVCYSRQSSNVLEERQIIKAIEAEVVGTIETIEAIESRSL